MSLNNDFHAALADTYATTLRQLLAEHPSATAADIQALVAEYPPLGALTLTQLLSSPSKKPAAPKTAPTKATAPKSKPARTPAAAPAKATPAKAPSAKPTPPQAGAGWDVRTETGRAKLQAAVLEALRQCGGSNVAASDMRSIGATPQQLRTTLNRLIDDGVVGYTGRARGTRYSLV